MFQDTSTPTPQTPTHPRDEVCQRAGEELSAWVVQWVARHQLTWHEFSYLLHTLGRGYARTLCAAEREVPHAGDGTADLPT